MKITHYLLIFLSLSITSVSVLGQLNQIVVGANNNGVVFNSFLDGTNPKTVNTNQNYFSFYGAVVDPIEEKIYMSWYYGIYSMDYDGSNFIQLYDYSSGGMGGAIDFYNNQIYFVDEGDNICKINTDGTAKDTIYSGLNHVTDLQIDTSNQEIYISRWLSSGGLDKINIDGTGYSNLFSGNISHFKIDFTIQTVFYGEETTVKSYDLNSTTSTQIHNFQAGEIDFYDSKLYMTNMSDKQIVRSNYNGSDIDTLIQVGDITFGTEELDTPSGLVLLKNDNACNEYINNTTSTISETISIDSVSSELSYQWLDCDNSLSPILDSINSSFTAEINGSYAVEISTAFCKDTSECVSILSTNINELVEESISLYPNPSNGLVHTSYLGENTIKIFSLDGKIIDTFNNVNSFQLPKNKGYYIIKIMSSNKIDTFKILKN